MAIPAPPSNVTPTVDANDQITLTWDHDPTWFAFDGSDGSLGGFNEGTWHSSDSVDHFEVQLTRDAQGWTDPSGGPTTVNANDSVSYSATYGPNSDNSYDSQVGIDSMFKFHVRAVNGDGASSWTTSGKVYTDAIPPHNPSVNRPDANTVEITWTQQSDIADSTVVEIREDTGSGYGTWSWFDSPGNPGKGNTRTETYKVGTDYSGNFGAMQEDARYQFRIYEYMSNGRDSDFAYTDYGNNGNVFFSDDFESGDLSAWDSTNLADDWGVHDAAFVDTHASSDDQFSNNRVHPVTGPDEGTYYLFGDGGGYVQKNLGDLSGESNVIVKCSMAAGSMDNSGEEGGLEWYDGSSWNNLEQFGHEYNRQEWVEVTALVPSSWLSTDNRLRLNGYGGSGDYMAWDRVVVSDIVDEVTKPAAVSNYSLDNSVEGEITATWTENASLGSEAGSHSKAWVYLDGNRQDTIFGSGSTYSPADDGEQYGLEAVHLYGQYRHGNHIDWWYSDTLTKSTITRHPAPTGASISNITPSSADLSWTDNSNNEDTQRVYLEQAGNPTGMEYTGLGSSEEVTVGPVPHDSSPTFTVATRFSYRTLDTGSTDNEWRDVVGSNGQGNFLLIEEGGNPTFRVPGDTTGFLGASNNISLDGTQDTCIATYDGSTKYCYVNDGPGNSESISNSSINLQGFAIGGKSGGSHNPDGIIYEVALYDRVFTSSERTDWENGIVPPDPIGHWPLDHNHNGVTRDLSEFANDGTVNGPSLTGTENGMEFDYSNQEEVHIDPSTLASHFGDDASLIVKCELNQNTPNAGDATGLIDIEGSGSSNTHYPWTNSDLYFSTFRSNRVHTASNSGFDKTKPHYLTITTTPGTDGYNIYQDGTLQYTFNGENTVSIDEAKIGTSGAGHHFDGTMYGVWLYNRELSASEVPAVGNSHPPANGLVAYWPLATIGDDGTTPDVSGYGNHGNVVGPNVVGDRPMDAGVLSPGTTTHPVRSLLDDTTYEAYIHTETEHSTTRDI